MSKLNGAKKVEYGSLNSKCKEQYNFQKISAVLADYGYATIKLSDDWKGADFIAQSMKGEGFLKVQLKARFTVARKYEEHKDLYVAFPVDLKIGQWCIYPHNEMINLLKEAGLYLNTKSWTKQGGEYSVPKIPKQLKKLLENYMIG